MATHRVLRSCFAFATAAALLAVAGCAGPPQVTFSAAGQTAVAGPTQYCDLALTRCEPDADAPVDLPVPPGTPVQVQVPAEIADTPWQVVYIYRDAAGEQVDERSAVFPPQQRSVWSLELPAGARLLTAQVQQYGPPPQIDPTTGEVQFPIRASWILQVAA